MFRVVVILLFILMASPAVGGNRLYTQHNPYGSVNWSTTLKCQAQHHDHILSGSMMNNADDDGYCAVTWLDYEGGCDISDATEWVDDGEINPDPGQIKGFWGYKRWPPTDHGAPAVPGIFTSLKFYIPGAENVGFSYTGAHIHTYSLGMLDYIDSEGCGPTNCNPASQSPSGTSCAGVEQSYNTAQGMLDRISALGGTPILAHNGGGLSYQRLPAVEIFNNLFALEDQGDADTANVDAYMAGWDGLNDREGGGIWGTSVNDRYGNSNAQVGSPASTSTCAPNCTGVDGNTFGAADIDRGKLEVLLPTYNYQSYLAAFRDGASFAIVENNATKSAYPNVTEIGILGNVITITTVADSETVTWVSNGASIVGGNSFSLDLSTLPLTTTWVRAELDDGAGRILYTQPFSIRTIGNVKHERGMKRP